MHRVHRPSRLDRGSAPTNYWSGANQRTYISMIHRRKKSRSAYPPDHSENRMNLEKEKQKNSARLTIFKPYQRLG